MNASTAMQSTAAGKNSCDMSEKLLEVKNLRVSYHTYAGEVQSVRGVSFTVNKGCLLYTSDS